MNSNEKPGASRFVSDIYLLHGQQDMIPFPQHDRLNVERRVSESTADSKQQTVKTSDVARLIELFQSSLLKYWQFEPVLDDSSHSSESSKTPSTSRSRKHRCQNSDDSRRTRMDDSASKNSSGWRLRFWRRKQSQDSEKEPASEETHVEREKSNEKVKPLKKMPVGVLIFECF